MRSIVRAGIETYALFSEDRKYRYVLSRTWDRTLPRQLWLMLNPSIADERINDPTVERCQRRSIEDGFGGITVCNIFALVSTDPALLYNVDDPIGPDNDEHIVRQARIASQVVCGWGGHGYFRNRGNQVRELLKANGIEPYALRVTKHGHPGHPLYVGYDVKPEVFA